MFSLSFVFALALSQQAEQPLPLLLTGSLVSEYRQNIVAPMSDTWRIQVQWLKPENEAVQAGDLVAVFDAGTIQANIERLKTSLISAQEQYKQLESQHALKVLEAEYELERRQLLLEKADIDAAVPKTNLSLYDYENNQLTQQRARTELKKAQETLVTARQEQQNALYKQQLVIEKTAAELAEAEQNLSKMSVYAERDGAISYSLHPWYRTKLFAGVTAQPGWLIAEVTEQQGLYVEAWVHEVDVGRLRQASQISARFDIAPEQQFALQLQELAGQGEKRQAWGNALYYRAKFTAESLPISQPMLGMGLLLEAR
ncbi:multidrug resistance efflux pump [Alishewanella aestuarii B11]|uniref:Multidrug resistance efflux pump n=1 Tax=Alishewanella aestuarii B11 TaxID=1197174 RepID=J1QG58_9ALTE|nr:HlyD family efflux transporter periplasmic adaptor subunit [Alishewanella aestuarii]EJI84491.1 multidrug resistance efflux pump [Alishewanella aestuarii B11]